MRDFATQAGSLRKEKAKQKTANEKDAKTRAGHGADKSDKANPNAAFKGKKCPKCDWAAWKRKMNTAAARAKEPGERTTIKRTKTSRREEKRINSPAIPNILNPPESRTFPDIAPSIHFPTS